MIISHLCEAIAREVWTEFVCDTNSHETCNSLEREPGGGGGRERHEKDRNICFMFTVRCSLRRETDPSRGYKESHSYLMERRSVGFLSGKTSLAVELYFFFKKEQKRKKTQKTCVHTLASFRVLSWELKPGQTDHVFQVSVPTSSQ